MFTKPADINADVHAWKQTKTCRHIKTKFWPIPYPHQNKGLCLCFLCLWKVKVHLISIKVSIERVTAALIKPECSVGHHLGLKYIHIHVHMYTIHKNGQRKSISAASKLKELLTEVSIERVKPALIKLECSVGPHLSLKKKKKKTHT